nr:hypothetical protein [Kineobactrum salinum]
MDAGHLYYRRVAEPLGADLASQAIATAVKEMRDEAVKDMRGEGFQEAAVTISLQLFVCVLDGIQEVMIQAPADFYAEQASMELVLAEAGQALTAVGEDPGRGMQLVTVALMAQAPVPHYRLAELPEQKSDLSVAEKCRRPLYLGSIGDYRECPVYDRERLVRGAVIPGPALVESGQTTILVSEGWKMTLDKFNNALLEGV